MNTIDEIDEGLEIKRKFSLVWVIPLLAIIVTSWLVYNNYINAGHEITVVFKTGAQLRAGKTPIKYLGIEVGKVTDVSIHEKDAEKVKATITLHPRAALLAREGTMFWVVKPRVDFENVSGLETILSGAYIGVKPPTTEFEKLKSLPSKVLFSAVETPPSRHRKDHGAHFKFFADVKGSIMKGSGVYYKDIKVGHVLSFSLNQAQDRVAFEGVIYDKYRSLVQNGYSLWRVNPLSVDLSKKGINLGTAPIEVIAKGGVGIGLFENKRTKENYLYSSKSDAKDSFIKDKRVKRIVLRADSMRGISEGAPVLYKKVKVGEIGKASLSKRDDNIKVEVLIYPKYRSLVSSSSLFWHVGSAEIEAKASLLKITTPTIKGLINGGIEFKNSDFKIQKNRTIFSSKSEAEDFLRSSRPGLRLKLVAKRRWSLDSGSPVYYRQVKVGNVENTKLSTDGKSVDIKIFIERKYRHLVYKKTKFWNVGGIGTEFSLVKGLKIKTESLKSIIQGGISFATPELKRGGRASAGDNFTLYERPNKIWTEWRGKLVR